MTPPRALPLTLDEAAANSAGRVCARALAYLCYLTAALILLSAAARAQIPGTTQNVTAAIEAETTAPAPGSTVTVAIVMDPKPGWHDYWLNPGDAGTPLELEWKLPSGVTAGPIRAPVPETLIVGGFMNHIYKAPHAFLIDLKIAPQLQPRQQIDIAADARWSACSDTVCIPEQGTLRLSLVAGDGKIAAADRARFDQWRAALPVPLDRTAHYAIDGERLAIAIPYPASADVAKVWFFARTDGIVRYAAPQSARRSGDWLVIETALSGTPKGAIEGLLRFNDAQGLEIRALPGVVPAGGDPVSALRQSGSASNPDSTVNFGWILGFSILGGLLLNLMPCVFPILGLKALSLAKMGGDAGAAKRDALAYSAGVIASCLALGGIMLALRAGGEEIGWAFQLQEPAVVLLLLLLMVAVTANLAGLFEIGAVGIGDGLTRKGGMAGSFWTGVLAAVVATPCTGPFMAAAMGAALLLPPAQALLLFAGLGLGLALPFLVLAYVPATRRMLPKPGPWLGTFRKAMAIPMGLTVLALLWLLWRLSGDLAALVGLALVAVVIALLWQAGRGKKGHRAAWPLAAILLLYGMGATALHSLPDGEMAPRRDLLRSEAFNAERLTRYRNDGRNVFVYFTADWCVTCKVNEAAAIDRAETRAAFEKAGIVTLKGDFTRRDPAIARFLAQHGRSGVPLYLYYPAGGEPVELPQILTVDMLTGLAR